MQLRFRRVEWEYASVFRTSSVARTHSATVQVELLDAGYAGRAEACGTWYRGETPDRLLDQLSEFSPSIRRGISRAELQRRMPPGGARNALDCAMWDLEAKRSAQPVWRLAGFSSVRSLITAYTVSIDSPEQMARSAAKVPLCRLLKLKMMGDGLDVERINSVRRARPDAEIIVDANQAWTERQLQEILPDLEGLGVQLIEQPLPVDEDECLRALSSPIPICADESCQTSESLAGLSGKYHYVNIKLDKSGGLTEALHMARVAKSIGLRLMVGCMGGSSLAMAPGFLVGQLCEWVDLDSPVLIKKDIDHGIRYEGNHMDAPVAALWG